MHAGANVGVFTRKALWAGASKVIAIEAGPENLECLRRTFAAEIADGRVVLYSKGIWDKDDILKFAINPANSAMDTFVSVFVALLFAGIVENRKAAGGGNPELSHGCAPERVCIFRAYDPALRMKLVDILRLQARKRLALEGLGDSAVTRPPVNVVGEHDPGMMGLSDVEHYAGYGDGEGATQ